MESDPVPKLVALLRTHAARLNARVLGEMYANPFWDDRYGARGRRFAQDDGASHVAHLVLALEAHTPEGRTPPAGHRGCARRVLLCR